MAKRLDLKDVNIYYGKFHAVADVGLSVPPRSVTAFIGPSGCGKSTVLRSLNRMHEVIPGARVEGSVLLDGEDIYGSNVDPATGKPGQLVEIDDTEKIFSNPTQKATEDYISGRFG
eukprot:gene21851-26236_t